MKNNITCCLLFMSMLKSAHAIHDDPAEIIQRNITNPSEAMHKLSKFDSIDLAYYRGDRKNNLLHIMVQTLMDKKDAPNYNSLQEQTGDLIFYLKYQGVAINEFNDDDATPLFLIYRDPNRSKHEAIESLLEQYGAQPTYWSPQHEIKKIFKFITGCCLCRSKHD